MTARRKGDPPKRERVARTRIVLGVCAAAALVVAVRFVVLRADPPEIPVPSKGVIDDPDIAAAVDAAVAAVRAAPGDADAWAELAMTYDANVIPSAAAACYRRAVELRPGAAEWWYGLAAVLEREDHSDDADAALRRAAELAPDYAPLRVSAALWALTRGRADAAETEAQRAMTVSGGSADALVALGRVQLELGRDEDAAKTLARAVEAWPKAWGDAAYPRFLLGTALSRLGRKDEALPMLANGVVQPPQFPDPWRDAVGRRRLGVPTELAKIARFVEANRLKEALASAEALHGRRPDSVAAANSLGYVYLLASRADDAVAVLSAAAQAHPDASDTAARLVSALWIARREGEAMRAADAAVARFPQSFEVLSARGELLMNSDRAEAALADFSAAARFAPADAGPRASAGAALLQLGRDGPALASFEDALSRNSSQATAIAGMAILAARHGDAAAADRWLAKIAGVPPQAARLVGEARAARAAMK